LREEVNCPPKGKPYLFEELQKSRSFNCFLDFLIPLPPHFK